MANIWTKFEDKNPKLAKWVREGGLFVIISQLITVIKGVVLNFLPWAFLGWLGNEEFGFPKNVNLKIFGNEFAFKIFGNAAGEVNELGEVVKVGGASYFAAFLVSSLVFEILNFFMQKYLVFRNKDKFGKQFVIYFFAWALIFCLSQPINSIWQDGIVPNFVESLQWLGAFGTQFIYGTVAMLVMFFVNKAIFPESVKKTEIETVEEK